MTRWNTDPEGAALALVTSALGDIDPVGSVLLAETGAALARELTAPASTVTHWSRRYSASGPGQSDPPAGAYDHALLRLPKSRDEQRMAVHQCLGALAPHGQLIVFGGNDEGIRSCQKHLALFGPVVTLATRGHGRVLQLRRADVAMPILSSVAMWREINIVPVTLTDWISYPGLFAGGLPDPGTQLLLDHLPDLPKNAAVLDYGAGPGAISAAIQRTHTTAKLTMLDNDSVALLAASENVPSARLIAGDSLVAVSDQRFDLIISNPPLHVGFREDTSALSQLITASPHHLAPRGALILVVQRRIALDAALSAAFAEVSTLASTGSYRLWRACKPLAKKA